MFENMLSHINKTWGNKIKYAIFTGDIPAHYVWEITREQDLNTINYVMSTWKKQMGNIPLYSAAGNHEAVPVNEFSPVNVTGYFNMAWLYDALVVNYSNTNSYIKKNPRALQKIKEAGCYSAYTPDGVKIISLNTNMGCNSLNWWLSFPSPLSSDPNNQLHWLNEELFMAESKKEVVYLIQHIAGSEDECGYTYWNNFWKIMYRYENTILGYYNGHTHSDLFSVIFAKDGNTNIRPFATQLFPGSVTSFSNINPGFRIMEISTKTKAIIDFHNYYADLVAANVNNSPNWKLEYSAKSAYSLKDMSPASFYDLIHRFQKNTTLFDQYLLRRGKGTSPCNNDKCRKGPFCDLYNAFPGGSICGK